MVGEGMGLLLYCGGLLYPLWYGEVWRNYETVRADDEKIEKRKILNENLKLTK